MASQCSGSVSRCSTAAGRAAGLGGGWLRDAVSVSVCPARSDRLGLPDPGKVELEAIRRAAAISDEVFAALAEERFTGRSERDLDDLPLPRRRSRRDAEVVDLDPAARAEAQR